MAREVSEVRQRLLFVVSGTQGRDREGERQRRQNQRDREIEERPRDGRGGEAKEREHTPNESFHALKEQEGKNHII